MHWLDHHARIDSPLHRLPAGLKLALAVALVITFVTVPFHAEWGIAAGAALLALWLIARLPLAFLARRLLLLEPFVLGIGVLMLLQPNGVQRFTEFVIRSTLCLLTMLLLSNTTTFARLLGVLRWIRFPSLLITTLALMYRYLFVLLDEAQRMQRARRSRTFTSGRRRWWTSLAAIAAQLFVRASQRAERVYAAMCARGWE